MDEKDIFWKDLKEYIGQRLTAEAFENWVEAVYPIQISEQTITLAVPNKLTKNYWERLLVNYVLEYSVSRFGIEYRPIIQVALPERAAVNPTPSQEAEVEEANFTTSLLHPSYTFDNFVIGEDNKMASGAALAVVDNPGTTYNPFLIYGGVGLGKTHLMQAIGNELHRRDPSIKIKYATSESFVNDFITSIQNGTQEEFRNMYRKIDVLLIDDIQFLSNKDKTQEEFFHTFNALYNANKQIVLTSDRLPNNIDNLEERLISRFKWGLSTDITPPDLETRIAILRKKAANDNLDINSETLTYIANNVDTNIRELEGALMRVIAYAAIQGQEITTHLAAEALKTVLDSSEKQAVTIPRILDTVSKFYKISVEEIKGKRRKREIVLPRQIGMYLARELTESSFPKIGGEFGNKNHTTVIHAYEKIQEELKHDPQMEKDITYLIKTLTE